MKAIPTAGTLLVALFVALLVALFVARPAALAAQGRRDSLPPKQTWGAAAPAAPAARPAPPPVPPEHPRAGRGVRVVFPDATAPEQRLAPGWHQPVLPATDPLATRGGPYSAGPWRYYYLVASDTPLALGPARRTVPMLEALMGAMTFQAAAMPEVTSAIRQRVVRLGPAGTWTDALVAWQPAR